VHERRAGLQRRLGVDDHGQRVVLDEHLLGRVDHAVLAVADDDRDPLAHVLDRVAGERPVLGPLDLDAGRHPGHGQRALEVEVLAGEDGDAGDLVGPGRVDRDDAGVRLGRAHDGHVEHAGQHDVVDIAPLPGDHPGVLLAAQRLADPLLARCGLDGGHADTPWDDLAAESTALTMLW
jgi:hypothetical protein